MIATEHLDRCYRNFVHAFLGAKNSVKLVHGQTRFKIAAILNIERKMCVEFIFIVF